MKKLNLKFLMVRPSDGFLPLALLIVALLGRSEGADGLFMAVLFSRLFALATAPGLRQAFARQPSMRMARGSVLAALMLQPLGALLAAGLELFSNGGAMRTGFPCTLTAALLLNVEHIFYEYLVSAGEGHSAGMARFITALLTGGGLMLGSARSNAGLLPYGLEWLLVGAAISAAVSAVIGLLIGGPLKGRLNGEVLNCAPLSMIQCFVYPLAHVVVMSLCRGWLGGARTSAPFFAGLMFYELWRTPFRRSAMEARPMNRVLIAVCAVSAAVVGLGLLPGVKLPVDVTATAVLMIVSAACVWGVYGCFRRNEG